MNIAVITPTKEREEQLSLVIDCMNNQTVKPDMWVIVDDGKKPVSEDTLKKISVPYKYIHSLCASLQCLCLELNC